VTSSVLARDEAPQ